MQPLREPEKHLHTGASPHITVDAHYFYHSSVCLFPGYLLCHIP